MLSRASSTDPEYASDLPIWIALACSALALVVFFGWLTISDSTLPSLRQEKSLRVQPLSETGPASDNSKNAVSAIELAESETVSLVLPGNDSAGQGDEGHSEQQSVEENAAERASHQQPEAEHLATTAKVARREPTKEEASDAKARLMKALPGLADGSDRPASSTAQSNEPEQGTENSENSAPERPELPSADLSALRQLLAEATAITESEDEQVRAKRERREIMESLGSLSAALSFAPGSKVVNEAMSPVLRQIRQILADNPETRINVIVATNENAGEQKNRLLSQERGRALIARLVNEGLAFSRFSLEALSDEQLPVNTNRVKIQAHSES